jgi:hypothetical protein
MVVAEREVLGEPGVQRLDSIVEELGANRRIVPSPEMNPGASVVRLVIVGCNIQHLPEGILDNVRAEGSE